MVSIAGTDFAGVTGGQSAKAGKQLSPGAK
jgi:hypothetical protein